MLNSWKRNWRAKLHSFFSWCWLSYDGQLGYKLFAANHRQTQLLAEWFFSLGIFVFFGIFSYKKRTLGSYLLVQWQLSFFHNFFLYKNSEDPEALSRKGTFVSPLWFFFIWQPWIVYCWPFFSHHEQFLSFRAEHSHRCGKANQRISNVPGYLVSV